ncbi:MAG TPA: alanine--tRNA ligase [Candidatus Omnitrophota bacterium]|nr:alanine--tRNA ligase [Candidatus Omnitrophota bacterium]
MKTSEIRKSFLDFFKAKKHTIVKSDSLVPRNDPTLLFTGAGMNQFKDYFLGLRTGLERAASIQKCLRTGDLDQVGKTPYHHSFFEMLGNFSFGDYFKEEAIEWAWEFLTEEVKIPRERLYVSVHQDDKEALKIWTKKIGIPEKLIARFGDDSNFWPSDAPKLGPNGPCGPCSEIFYDQGENYPGAGKGSWAEDESGRYAEIWNLVFTQFERQEGGKLAPLKAKNIDTGMGLERLACVLQNVKSNFEIDIFQDIHKGVKFSLGFGEHTKIPTDHLYAISDHIRAVVFAMSDGVIPANEGRGYVVRKLIRRALWRGYELSSSTLGRQLKEPFLYKVSSEVVKTMKYVYPELEIAGSGIRSTLKNEEERFLNTLETGLKILEGHLSSLKGKVMPGDIVFELYDTYGFPDELTHVISKKSGKEIDEKGFETLLEEQRKRAKASSKIRDTIFSASDVNQDLLKLPETKFLGYETLEAKGKIVWLSFPGEEGTIVLDQTPFYPEGGGQVGDRGILQNKNFSFSVSDTQKKEKVIVHYGKLTKGTPKIGETCQAEVSKALREATKRNHTATHLLQAALRAVLGSHVRQVGSLVNPEKLRFDFTHGKALTEEEIKKIETWVNEAVLESSAVQATQQNYEQAMRSGTLAFFGDKYGDEVRVVEVPGKTKELCGGTHCHQTGEIGAFVITSETSIGSGTRRIEAITGLNAVHYLKELQKTVNQISSLLRVGAAQVTERIEKLQKKVRELEQKSSKREAQKIDVDALIQNGKTIGSVKLITQTVADETVEFLRQLADQIRTKAKQSVVVLFSTEDSKVNVIIALSKDLAHSTLDAKRLAQEVAPFLDGSAGGRKDLAQGGGRNREGIESAIKALSQALEKTV